MTLALENGTKPDGLQTKVHDLFGNKDIVMIGDYTLSMEDFLSLAAYALNNTDLKKDDPRLQFVEHVRNMEVVEGWDEGGKKLLSKVPVLQRR